MRSAYVRIRKSRDKIRLHLMRGGGTPDEMRLGVELVDELISQTPYTPINSATAPTRIDGSIAYAV